MKSSQKTYTTTDIAGLGTKRERLKEWMSRAYIKPSVQSAAGAGTKNLFSLWDLYIIQLFQYLIGRGFSREDSANRIRGLFLVGEIANEVSSSSKKISVNNRNAALKHYNRFLTSQFLILPKRGQGVDGFPFADRIANRDGSFEEPPIVICIVKDENGSFVEYYPNGKKSPFSLDNYSHCDDILIVNFKKIRDKVDAALE
jgi:hypothetical protein